MENIILIGHGSPRKEANNIGLVASMLHDAIHPGCRGNCVTTAYLQFAEPDIMSAIKGSVDAGSEKIILHPFFLSSGMHVTKDIPELIHEAEGMYPGVEFIFTEPLGVHEKLVQVVLERIREKTGLPVAIGEPKTVQVDEIEGMSFRIISEEADFSRIPEERHPIVKRVIHATADFEFKDTLTFHEDAVRTGIEAIKSGRNILTDIEMVKAGIIKKWFEPFGGRVICNINDEDVIKLSRETGRTRSELAIEKALKEDGNIGIIAIGNAPTALLKVVEILGSYRAAGRLPLVIGVPVGFVNALESKALLAGQSFPFITNLSRKGGTPVAVAIVNALLKIATGA